MPLQTRLWLPLAYMAAIFALSSIPDSGEPASRAQALLQWIPPDVQNLLHVPLFAGLLLSWDHALRPSLPLAGRLLWAVPATIAWGLLDEYHQLFVPGRFGSWTDAALDASGALLAAGWLVAVCPARPAGVKGS